MSTTSNENLVTTSCCEPQSAIEDCCSDSVENCCSDQGIQACCSTGETEKLGQTAAKIASPFAAITFIGLFIFGNYFLNDWIFGHLTSLNERVAGEIAFFISHTIGLLGILGSITVVAVFARSFINEEKVRTHMSRVNNFAGHGLAAGIGVATPFCSCSAVPVFTGFVRSGIPVSQAISLLVASPLVNEVAIGLLATWVGWKIAGVYALAGFLIAVLAGVLLKRIATPELTEVKPARSLLQMASETGAAKITFKVRLDHAVDEAFDLLKTTWIFVLIGVGVGAFLHGWLPVSTVENIAAMGPIVGVVAATLLGIPLYSGIATVIPIVSVLADKGMPMGTLLAFAMSVTALSLPEAMLLRKVMKPKLLALYFTTVGVGIILVGIAFNIALGS